MKPILLQRPVPKKQEKPNLVLLEKGKWPALFLPKVNTQNNKGVNIAKVR